MRVIPLTKIPSPYQVELFNAIAATAELDLTVLYLKEADAEKWAPREIAHSFNSSRVTKRGLSRKSKVATWSCSLGIRDGVWKLIRRRAH